MNKKIASILVGFCISLLAMTSLSEAQPMNEQALTARQQGIVVIAALTANGELEKLIGTEPCCHRAGAWPAMHSSPAP